MPPHSRGERGKESMPGEKRVGLRSHCLREEGNLNLSCIYCAVLTWRSAWVVKGYCIAIMFLKQPFQTEINRLTYLQIWTDMPFDVRPKLDLFKGLLWSFTNIDWHCETKQVALMRGFPEPMHFPPSRSDNAMRRTSSSLKGNPYPICALLCSAYFS